MPGIFDWLAYGLGIGEVCARAALAGCMELRWYRPEGLRALHSVRAC